MKTLRLAVATFVLACLSASIHAQGTAFTYNGSLNFGGTPANGLYDFQFQAFDGPNAVNNAVSLLIPVNAVPVTNGLFTATIDFGGGVFTGPPRWLQISVASNNVNPKVSLSPRQQLSPTPYSIFAATSATVTNGAITSTQLANGAVGTAQIQNNAINSGQIATGQVVKTVNGLTDNITLSAGGNITITPSGNTLQFSAPNTGGWSLAGNAGTVPGPNYVGTSDNQAFEAHVNGVRAMRLEPTSNNSANTNLVNVIGGSPANFVTPGTRGATIGGGGAVYYFGQVCTNSVTGDFGTVSGGQGNVAAGASVVGGGQLNTAAGVYDTIGGGEGNVATASSSSAFIGGGVDNITTRGYSVVGGGAFNLCSNNFGVIAGGDANTIAQNSEGASILGGENNKVQANATAGFIGGGISNSVTGNYGVVPGGFNNSAALNSFAAGYGSHAISPGSFVWSDPGWGSSLDFGSNTFNVFASSGTFVTTPRFECDATSMLFGANASGFYAVSYNNPTGLQISPSGACQITTGYNANSAVGVYLAAGGSGWNSLSDRNLKENFTDINARDVLEKVAAMPISIWNYKTQKKEIRHIGPMAQDFHAAFAVGEDDKHINNLDEEGVALAAIQGLNQKLEIELKQKDTQIQNLEKSLADLKATVSQLMEHK